MADLNRQLQEYLAQSKSGKSASPSGSSTALDLGDEEPVTGSWFGRWSGRWSSPFQRRESPSSGSGGSWPWSTDPDPCLPGLSRRQRLVAFGVCAAFSALCFGLSALYAPLLLLYARKFALLWSLGSLFAIAAVAMLRGPSKLLSGLPTSPAAAAYLCALGGTLYAALSLQSTALTALGAAVQVAVILCAVVSLLPGGAAGMRFMGGLAASAIKRTVSGKTMPI
ncbi:vesicle transport protein SFT2C [Periophthalmus magnuspinnatus]|uniref:vesicle transport protein SFT2C n=1 Tax=Periophthalmus magnuspinnatus TaxID=409849 RepID=UPI00145BBDFD|nr:vesicle transport protein SFT2C [Periophthalmus magnuspinnatus]